MQPTMQYLEIPRYHNQVTEQTIPTHRLAYVQWNNIDKPIVICLHGLTRNSRDFDYLAAVLAEKFCIIAVDIVGRGRSDQFLDKELYNYSTYLADLLYLINKLELTNIHMIGTSMGGIIAINFATIHPELVSSLVINDIGPTIPASALARIGKYANIQPYFSDLHSAKEYFKKVMANFGVSEHQNVYWQHITTHSTIKISDDKYTIAYDAGAAQGMKITAAIKEDVDFWDTWHKVNCPILLIRGDKSDILTSETAAAMLKSKENIELLTIKDSGHAPALVAIDQITDIYNWLSQIN